MEKVLILGGSGLVGTALIRELSNEFEVYATYNSNIINLPENRRFKLSVEDPVGLDNILDLVKPSIVISCLRGDFNNQALLHERLAAYIYKNNGLLYFCSTANVFDNAVDRVHYEYDKTEAGSDYGKFKASTEEALSNTLKDNLCILRLPMIWGKNSPRLNNLTNKLYNDEEIEVYPNLYFTNITDTLLAKQIHYLISNRLTGIYHLTSTDIILHQGFIMKLIEKLGLINPKLKEVKLAEEKHYLALLSLHDELPDYLRMSNSDIINELTLPAL